MCKGGGFIGEAVLGLGIWAVPKSLGPLPDGRLWDPEAGLELGRFVGDIHFPGVAGFGWKTGCDGTNKSV